MWEHIQWEQDQPELAHFQCPHCKECVEESGTSLMEAARLVAVNYERVAAHHLIPSSHDRPAQL
jgi:hypothetical protein